MAIISEGDDEAISLSTWMSAVGDARQYIQIYLSCPTAGAFSGLQAVDCDQAALLQ